MGINDNKLHVMYVTAGLHHGGAERVVATLCRNLDKERFNVSVCWLKGPGAIGMELSEEGINLIGIPDVYPNRHPYLYFLALRDIVNARGVNIVHSHDTAGLVDSAQCRLVSRNASHVHTFHFGNYPHCPTKDLFLERIFARVPDRLVAVSAAQSETISDTLHIARRRIETIYNGVENRKINGDLYEERPFQVGEDRPLIVGSISTLIEQKGIGFLLDTAKALKTKGVNCVFVVAGDGPLRGELEEKSRRLGLQNVVHFSGWVPNAGARLLPKFDVLFQPSLWEAMPMVVLEAMAAGVPVVTTDVGENRNIVENGNTGFIVPARDVNAMVEALSALLSSASRRREFGERAQARYERHYTANIMVTHYAEVYESLKAGKSLGRRRTLS
jgi:glycosyltransferase involved in cell wall biosynthesis